MYAGPPSPMDQFPNEIWDAIFKELFSQADLARVIRTCKKFYAIGVRVLHRHIVWLDPARFTASLDFIQRNPALHSIPRSLKLGVSLNHDCFRHKQRPSRETFHPFHLPNDLDVHDDAFFADVNPFLWGHDHHHVVENNSIAPGPSHYEPGSSSYPGAQALFNGFDPAALTNVHSWSDGRIPMFTAHKEQYHQLLHCIYSFTAVQDLHFEDMALPPEYYTIIRHFPHLRRLHIEHCVVPRHQFLQTTPPDMGLPIRELTLLDLKGYRDDIEKVCSLSLSPQLNYLRFDFTAYHAFKIYATEGAIGMGLPQNLQTVDAAFPNQKSWPNNQVQAETETIIPFQAFLTSCKSITRLHIRNYIPFLILPPDALPLLKVLTGPLVVVPTVTHNASRPLRTIDVREPTVSIRHLLMGISEIARSHPDLQDFRLYLHHWDNEVIYAIVQHFPKLRNLLIRYREGSPHEDFLVSLGARFLCRLQDLESVQIHRAIYPPQKPSHYQVPLIAHYLTSDTESHDVEMDDEKCASISLPKEDEATLLETVHAWNRPCPRLREVGLVPGFVWRRTDEKDPWCKRTYHFVGQRRVLD